MPELKLENLSDQELVDLTLKNQENFLYLMKRYQQPLLFYIKRLSNFSNDQAEDVLQETFIKTYYNLNDFDKSLKFSSWIYRICHNQLIDSYRKTKTRPQNIYSNYNDEMIEGIMADFNIDREIDKEYLKEKMTKIMAILDFKYREVLILKFFEGKDYKEMSDILKKPMGTVATLISRAKKQFREKLKDSDLKF